MARVRASDYDEKRSLIVARAADLFAGQGFERVSMASIAEHCRFSKSTLYHYFEAKDEILHELLSGHLEASLAAVDAACDDGAEPRSQVRSVVRALAQQAFGVTPQQHGLMQALDALPPGPRAEIEDLQRRLIERVEDVLLRLGPALRRRHGGARPVTLVLLAMVGVPATWPDPADRPSPIELARLTADLFLDGFDAVAPPV